MDLSIIIPVWNEESKIQTDIVNINTHFKKSNVKIELIIVDDGSSDNTIHKVKLAFEKVSLQTAFIVCKHMGKGHAVCQGIKASKGRIAMFMDCGSNVPLNFIDKGIQLLDTEDADMVLGTRYRAESKIIIDPIWYRKITSAIFRKVTHLCLNLPKEISDSQCGFKLFKGDKARNIFKQVAINGFLFDLEVILSAHRRGYILRELPLEWRSDRDSRLSIRSSLFPVIKEFLYLRKL